MMRSLLLALVLALAVAAPAHAHSGPHDGTGTVTAVSATSITVRGEIVPAPAQGNELTCAVLGSHSPSVGAVRVGERVRVGCNWIDSRLVLITLDGETAAAATRKFSGSITALSRAAVAVRTAKGTSRCAVTTAAARRKLRGMKVGHKVTLTCRLAGSRMILISAQHVGAHAGHAQHGG